jgi:hypothetical protein
MIDGAPSVLTLPASLLLEAWERGRDASPGEQGLLLLSVAHPEQPAAALAGWTVGRRDAALLLLRERVFGPRLAALADCPQCNEPLEMELDVSAILVSAPEATNDRFALEWGGYRVAYRLPTAGDLAALDSQTSARDGGQARARWLIERCIVQVEGGQGAGLPAAVLDVLEAAMAEAVVSADPQAEVELALTCPACGTQWQAPFDIVSFLWQELDAWADRLLGEVHVLASHYGWSEREILALSPWRRQRYLDRIGV